MLSLPLPPSLPPYALGSAKRVEVFDMASWSEVMLMPQEMPEHPSKQPSSVQPSPQHWKEHQSCKKYSFSYNTLLPLHWQITHILSFSVYTKTYNLMTKWEWCTITHAHVCITWIYAMIWYTSVCVVPYQGQFMNFSCFQRLISQSASSGSVPCCCYTLPPWYGHQWCLIFRSGMSVTGLPQIPSEPPCWVSRYS